MITTLFNRGLILLVVLFTVQSTRAISAVQADARSGEQQNLAAADNYLSAHHASLALPIYSKLTLSADPAVRRAALFGQAIAFATLKDPRAEGALAAFLRDYPKAAEFPSAAYELGRLRFSAGSFQAAAEAFDLAAASPSSGQVSQAHRELLIKTGALYWGGLCLQKLGRSTDAVSEWSKETLADPQNQSEYTGEALASLAAVDLAANDAATFQQHVEAATKSFAASEVVSDQLLELGAAALRSHRPDQAIFVYRSLSASPRSPVAAAATVDLGIACLQTTPPQPEAAIAAFKGYLAKQPDGPLADRAALNLGEAYEALPISGAAGAAADLARADLRNALAAYRQALALTQDNDLAAHAAWKVGALEGKLNDFAAALADLNSAIAKYPHSHFIDKMYFEKAHVYQSARQYPAAQAAFQTYLATFPNAPDVGAAYFNLGVVEYNLAGARLQTAARSPNTPAGAQALQLAQMGYAAAASDFSRTIQTNAAAPLDMAYFYQGWAYLHCGESQKALQSFQMLRQRFPNSPQAVQAEGRIGILEASTNPAEAIQYITEYLTTNPTGQDATDANLALGEAYVTSGDWVHAEPALSLALRSAALPEQEAACHYFLGRCLVLQGKPALARVEFGIVIKQYPNLTLWVQKARTSLAALAVSPPKQPKARPH